MMGCLYVVITLCAMRLAHHLIFRPGPPTYDRLNGQVSIPSEEVTLAALYLKHPSARYTVCFFHGNAEDLGDTEPFLNEYYNQGYNIFSFDYRSYGQSGGSPNEMACYKDLEAIRKYLMTELKLSPEKLIFHGRSLGGAMAVEMASQMDCGGLIMESTFVSAYRVMTGKVMFPFDQFLNLKKMKDVSCPVLVIHGKEDEVIPFWHGKMLFDHASGKRNHVWVDHAGHNDLYEVLSDGYWSKINQFVKENVGHQ